MRKFIRFTIDRTDYTLKNARSYRCLFSRAGQSVIAQNALGMSQEELEALLGLIGKEDQFDLTGKPNKNGRADSFRGD